MVERLARLWEPARQKTDRHSSKDFFEPSDQVGGLKTEEWLMFFLEVTSTLISFPTIGFLCDYIWNNALVANSS